MPCFYHPDRDAVNTCSKCGKPVCNVCNYIIGTKPICRNCYDRLTPSDQQNIEISQNQASIKDSRKLNTSRIIFIVFSIIVLGLFATCAICLCPSPNKAPTIPQDAVNEIYDISSPDLISKYISIKSVEDKGTYLTLMLDVKYNPELHTNLEDGFKQSEMWTKVIAQDTVKVLSKYGIDTTVFVWAEMPVGNNEYILFGKTTYNQYDKTYKFERYKK